MISQKDANIVAAIKSRYGDVIDLNNSPAVIIEVIHNFRHLLDESLGPNGSGGGPPGPSRSALQSEEVGNATVLNLLLELKRDVRDLGERIK